MSNIKAIRCKSCHAPMPLRVASRQLKTLNCNYCGQVHSIADDFKKLYKFTNPIDGIETIKLGTNGKINGIEFTVIGFAVYTEEFTETLDPLGNDEYWIDYQLYSKTHGYAFLTHEDGDFTLFRRVRELPTPLLSASQEDETVNYQNMDFKVDEPYQSYLYFVAGSLTWLAKAGDKTECLDALHGEGVFSSADYILSYEKSKNEEEYYLGEPAYEMDDVFTLELERLKSYKKKSSPRKSQKKHPKSVRRKNRKKSKPRSKKSNKSTKVKLFDISLLAFLVGFLALMVFMAQDKSTLFYTNFLNQTDTKEFTVTKDLKNYELELKKFHDIIGNSVEHITIRNKNTNNLILDKNFNFNNHINSNSISLKLKTKTTYVLKREQRQGKREKLQVALYKPVLLRYFILFLFVSITGMIIGRAQEKNMHDDTATRNIFITFTLGIFFMFWFAPIALFVAAGSIFYATITFRTYGFLLSLASWTTLFNLLSN